MWLENGKVVRLQCVHLNMSKGDQVHVIVDVTELISYCFYDATFQSRIRQVF